MFAKVRYNMRPKHHTDVRKSRELNDFSIGIISYIILRLYVNQNVYRQNIWHTMKHIFDAIYHNIYVQG